MFFQISFQVYKWTSKKNPRACNLRRQFCTLILQPLCQFNSNKNTEVKREKKFRNKQDLTNSYLDWASVCLKQCLVGRCAQARLCYWIWIHSGAQRHQSSRLINKKPAGRRRRASSQSVSPGKCSLMSSVLLPVCIPILLSTASKPSNVTAREERFCEKGSVC